MISLFRPPRCCGGLGHFKKRSPLCNIFSMHANHIFSSPQNAVFAGEIPDSFIELWREGGVEGRGGLAGNAAAFWKCRKVPENGSSVKATVRNRVFAGLENSGEGLSSKTICRHAGTLSTLHSSSPRIEPLRIVQKPTLPDVGFTAV